MQKTSLTAFLEKDSSSLGLSVEVAAEGRRGSWGSSPKTHLTTVLKWGTGVILCGSMFRARGTYRP